MNPKLKRYWSGVKNFRSRAVGDDTQGKKTRLILFENTGDAKFKESNFQKQLAKGKTYKLNDIRGANKTIMTNRNDNLRKEFKKNKKSGDFKGTFKEFKRANRKEPDFNAVQEQFNSA